MLTDHSHSSPRPIFGIPKPGAVYTPRPGAYAVILNSQMEVATIQVEDKFFLPGGGIQAGELAEGALQREVLEESGWSITIGKLVGEAIDYIEVGDGGPYYEIQSSFYRAELAEKLADSQEPDHHLVWLQVDEAYRKLRRKSQAWVVGLYIG